VEDDAVPPHVDPLEEMPDDRVAFEPTLVEADEVHLSVERLFHQPVHRVGEALAEVLEKVRGLAETQGTGVTQVLVERHLAWLLAEVLVYIRFDARTLDVGRVAFLRLLPRGNTDVPDNQGRPITPHGDTSGYLR
jgi:DNA-binding transcriptional ArsR family regulator